MKGEIKKAELRVKREEILFSVKYHLNSLKRDGKTIVKKSGVTALWGTDEWNCVNSFCRKYPHAHDVSVTACLLSKICQTRRRA